MRRVAIAGAAAVLASLALTGCDDRPCLASHVEYMPMTQMVGKTPVTTLMPYTVCDRYGPKPK